MPKVLIYAPIIGRGGVHRMITELANHWGKASGWEFTILSQRHDENGNPIAWPETIEFTQIDGGVPPRHPHLTRWLYEHQADFYAHWKRMKADVTYLPMPWWTARLPNWKPAMPTVATLHDFAWDQLQYPAHEFRAEAQVFAQSGLFACFPSTYQREWGEAHYGFRQTRTIYHGHFIASSFLPTPYEAQRVREKYGLPDQYVLAFHVANSKKDPIAILRGHVEARRRSRHVPALVLAGLDTEWFAPPFVPPTHFAHSFVHQVVRCIMDCGYQWGRDLFVLGGVPETDIGGLYAGASVAVTATHNEGGISGAMFEAFAAHTSSIYTDLPVFSERLTPPGEHGYVFPAGDVDALAGCIVEACTDIAEATRRAANAFRFANSRTWGDAAQEYLTVFKEVLHGK